MMVFNKCCFCIPLRLGCLILAYLHLLGSFLGVIISVMFLVMGLGEVLDTKPVDVEKAKTVLAYGGTFLTLRLIFFSSSIVLLVGLYMKKPSHLKVFLISNVVFLIILLIDYVIYLINVFSTDSLDGLFQGIIILGLGIYFLLVIRSYYVFIKEEQDMNKMKSID